MPVIEIPRPHIITLCGSTRYRREYEDTAARFSLCGFVVLTCSVWKDEQGGPACTEDQKSDLDRLHMHKIEMADEVFIINRFGYIGESTRREIKYAHKLGKPIEYLESPRMEVIEPSGPRCDHCGLRVQVDPDCPAFWRHVGTSSAKCGPREQRIEAMVLGSRYTDHKTSGRTTDRRRFR
jgi:hypothetical protein